MIQIKALEFKYAKTDKKAIKGIDFNIEEGEIFGFLGPSGAGKTTTQRLIIGLLRGYQGHIHIMGKERREWKKDFYEHVGIAFDFPNLYLKLTGRENLELISGYYKKKPKDISSLLEEVGLTKDAHKKVEGYSKGMKMRLNFIRALMHDPQILFFDEPTSGLDPINARIIKDTLLQLKEQGKTIFLTTHNMTVASQLCDRVALISEGKLVACDSPKNLMMNYGSNHVKVEYAHKDRLREKTYDLDTISRNADFMDLIQKQKIVTIHSGEATLEDVFIRLTGRKLI